MPQGTNRLSDWAKSLPSFPDRETARSVLFAKRDEQLLALRKAAESQSKFVFDTSPESLKALEAWYFDLHDRGEFESTGIPRLDFESCMHTYFCDVLAKNAPGMGWLVEDSGIVPGNYALGVGKPLFFLVKGTCSHLPKLKKNKLRNSLWREFRRWAR